ncbi:MAG: glycoside hydrolase family 2 protein [bacterium]
MSYKKLLYVLFLLPFFILTCSKNPSIKSVPPAINTSFPVMPNSKFAPLIDAKTISVDSISINSNGSYVSENTSQKIMLTGLYKFTIDTNDTGESQATPFYSPAYNDTQWLTVNVPDNYQVDVPGLENYFGPVWYRTHFTLTTTQAQQHNILIFDGVDYFAKVWLNGTLLGEHEGYFDPIMFDVSNIVKPGDNVLVVRVLNPDDPSFQVAYNNTGITQFAEKIWIKGILDFHDTRPGDSLTPQDSQSMGTGGIYLPVYVYEYNDVRWDDVFITPVPNRDYSSADIYIDYFLTNSSGRVLKTTVQTYVDLPGTSYNTSFDSVVWLEPGTNHFTLMFTINKPALWWLYDHPELGKPNVYRASFVVSTNDQIQDIKDETFGIRVFTLNTDTNGNQYFSLNGRRIFLRGTTYIPTEWMSHITQGMYEQDISLMKDAGMDAFDIHDHIEPALLLDTADKDGMGVFYNFSLIWEYSVCDFERPDGDPNLTNNIEVIKRMLASALYLTYNHPSVLMWTLHDEPFYSFVGSINSTNSCPPTPIPFGSAPEQNFLDHSFNKVLDDSIYPVATGITHNIVIHESGNIGDNSTTYYGWYTSNAFDIDTHPIPFPIEFGAEAVPYAIQPIMEQELGSNYWPADQTSQTTYRWQYHDLQLPVESLYIGKPSSYPDFTAWAYASQLYQAVVSKEIIESTRIHKYNPTYSEFNFMLNDWWPSMAWGIVDWNRKPLIAYNWISTVDQPIMVAVKHGYNIYTCGETITLPVFIVNDLYKNIDGTLSYHLAQQTDSTYITGDASGLNDGYISKDTLQQLQQNMPVLTTVTIGTQVTLSTLVQNQIPVTIPDDSANLITTITFTPSGTCTSDQHYTLYMDVTDANGNNIAHNWYHFIVR